MFVALPMYDWPELRTETDAFWSAIRIALSARGIDAPAGLNRTVPAPTGWLRDDLLLSQTCGLPYVRSLRGRVRLVGAVSYDLPGIPTGHYASQIVIRADHPAETFADLRGTTVAFNHNYSQSGAGALRTLVAPLTDNGRFFGAAVAVGVHAASIRAVANGEADVAAIDAVSWRLAERHMPEAQALRVLTTSPPMPGLPLITGHDGPAQVLAEAIGEAVSALPQPVRAALLINGVLPCLDNDFDGIAANDEAARHAGYVELDGEFHP